MVIVALIENFLSKHNNDGPETKNLNYFVDLAANNDLQLSLCI